MISFENMNSFQFWKPNIYATPSCWWQFCISLAGYGVSLPLMWKQHLSQSLWLANCKIKLPTVFLSRQLFWLALEQGTYILNIDVLNVEKRQNTNLYSPKAGVTRQSRRLPHSLRSLCIRLIICKFMKEICTSPALLPDHVVLSCWGANI